MQRLILCLLLLFAGCAERASVYGVRGQDIVEIPAEAEIESEEELLFINRDGYYLTNSMIRRIGEARGRGKKVALIIFDADDNLFVPGPAKIEWEEDLYFIDPNGQFVSKDYLREVMETKVRKPKR